MGLHQGLTLSLLRYVLVIDELTRGIQVKMSWYILFVVDIILIDDTCNRVSDKLGCSRLNVQVDIRRTQTEYMKCKFNDVMPEVGMKVRLDIKKKYPYERQIQVFWNYSLQGSRASTNDITNHIGASWMKSRFAYRALCDKKVPPKLKDKFEEVV